MSLLPYQTLLSTFLLVKENGFRHYPFSLAAHSRWAFDVGGPSLLVLPLTAADCQMDTGVVNQSERNHLQRESGSSKGTIPGNPGKAIRSNKEVVLNLLSGNGFFAKCYLFRYCNFTFAFPGGVAFYAQQNLIGSIFVEREPIF